MHSPPFDVQRPNCRAHVELPVPLGANRTGPWTLKVAADHIQPHNGHGTTIGGEHGISFEKDSTGGADHVQISAVGVNHIDGAPAPLSATPMKASSLPSADQLGRVPTIGPTVLEPGPPLRLRGAPPAASTVATSLPVFGYGVEDDEGETRTRRGNGPGSGSGPHHRRQHGKEKQ